MAEIIARFVDGRLLVEEEKAIESHYTSGGIAFRIPFVKTVEKVLSIEAIPSGYPQLRLGVPLTEVLVSGDTIIPRLFRADLLGLTSGYDAASGYTSLGILSSIVASGTVYGGPLASSISSGIIRIKANVIGY